MYVDEAVIAGVITVGLMVAFLGGVGLFIWRDAHKKKTSDLPGVADWGIMACRVMLVARDAPRFSSAL